MNRLLTNNLPVLFALLLLTACAGSRPAATASSSTPDSTRAPAGTAPKTTTAAKPTAPAEDLSVYRPAFPAPAAAAPARPAARPYAAPANNVNAQIDQRLRDQAVANQSVKYTQGFRVQVYVGLDRDQAMAIRRSVISRYPDETDYLTYKQPVYHLYIGDYMTRLEAEQALLRLKPLAPKAELQQTQVLVNKTRF